MSTNGLNGFHGAFVSVDGTPEGKPGKKLEKVAASLGRLEGTSQYETRRRRLQQLLNGTRYYPAGTKLASLYYTGHNGKTNGTSGVQTPKKNGVQELRGGVGDGVFEQIIPEDVATPIFEEEHFIATAEKLLEEQGQEL